MDTDITQLEDTWTGIVLATLWSSNKGFDGALSVPETHLTCLWASYLANKLVAKVDDNSVCHLSVRVPVLLSSLILVLALIA